MILYRWIFTLMLGFLIQYEGMSQWKDGTDYFGLLDLEIYGLPPIDSLRQWGVRHIRVAEVQGDSMSLEYDRKFRLKRYYKKNGKSVVNQKIFYTHGNRIKKIERKSLFQGKWYNDIAEFKYIPGHEGWFIVVLTIRNSIEILGQDSCEIQFKNGQLVGMKSDYYGEFSETIDQRGDTTDVYIERPGRNYLSKENDTTRITIRTICNALKQPLEKQCIYHRYFTDCGVGMFLSAHWTYDDQNRLTRYIEYRGGYDICFSIQYLPDGSREVTETRSQWKEDLIHVFGSEEYLWIERITELPSDYRFYFE